MKTDFSIYQKNELKSQINVGAIYTVHYFKYGKNFRVKGERHDFWEMVFIDSGKANILAENVELQLAQGEAFFHKPGEMHTISTNEDFANSAIISFECKSRALKPIAGKIVKLDEFEKTLLNKIIFEAKANYSDKLNDIYLTKMNKADNPPFGGEQVIKNSIELLLISLLRKQESSSIPNYNLNISSGTDKIVNDIINILNDKLDLASSINLNELSFKLGFSKSYIKTQFKKNTGISIIQYFINLKIERAKKMLSQQKYSVSEIADALGFSSIYYFSRQFKLHTDMSPSEYVNSIQADNVL